MWYVLYVSVIKGTPHSNAIACNGLSVPAGRILPVSITRRAASEHWPALNRRLNCLGKRAIPNNWHYCVYSTSLDLGDPNIRHYNEAGRMASEYQHQASLRIRLNNSKPALDFSARIDPSPSTLGQHLGPQPATSLSYAPC